MDTKAVRGLAAAILVAAMGIPILVGCGSSGGDLSPFIRTNLVADKAGFSDAAGTAANTDANLVNPWGIAFSPTGPFWISDNGTGLLTLYDGTGAKQALVVSVPAPGAAGGGTPTGQVFNSSGDFSGAKFLASTEDGTIVAWSAGTSSTIRVDNSGTGAVYKGLAIASSGSGNFLYATNFHAGTVDVFNGSFAPATLSGNFTDPSLPAGFAPFGIQSIGGNLYVTYAKQDAAKHDDVAGPGNGLVDIFDTNGHLLQRLITGTGAGGTNSELNSPWGLAMAPASFGSLGNSLLVGNFGDGRITAFSPTSGIRLGQLKDTSGHLIAISGLWGLAFGNGSATAPAGTLFFTAGTNDESDGLFGSIRPAP